MKNKFRLDKRSMAIKNIVHAVCCISGDDYIRRYNTLKPHYNKAASYAKISFLLLKTYYKGLFIYLLHDHFSFTLLKPIFCYIRVHYIEV